MTKEPPQVNLNGNYELKAAAELLEVNRATILRWTRQGLIRSKIRRANGRKIWTGAELLRAWQSSM